jgi:hypothetical protein
MKIDNTVALSQVNNINKNQTFSQDDKKLREQTDAYEAMIVKQYLEMAMKEENSLFPKTPGHDIYKSMQIDSMSKQLGGNFGFSQMMFDYLKENRQ